ncbi:hypothetical protein HYPSUDRAFT_61890 [Hypholoma sublateritium FD-334 SS-4]|uniref:Uncharacterized protein n=1 Tax=Hypholoma sublateritium (strain FD-334 SS-4) TaxID=945553 RepID=A0A0D2LM51_HYPSF|nr:hypothetical protein HYPSUDRAFT_61890 [Hypholoma sublateritium FD-334 SS-4]
MSVPPHFLVPIHNVDDGAISPRPVASSPQLPFELVEALNQTYFLHLLVTQPEKVVPPGKSLLSMMTHANYVAAEEDAKNSDKHDYAKANHQAIEKKVKEVAHRAFWNEALEMLSSPLPSVQLSRLKQLYSDIHEALAPHFPPGHRILVSLESPLPPTSSPLHSTMILLKEIVTALRERCAPVRDEAVDNLARSLENLPPTSAESHTELSQFVLDSMKNILQLAEDMRRDLNTFVLGAMSESQLKGVLTRDVKKRERGLVIKIWGGQENVRVAWREWVSQLAEESNGETKWLKRLFLALGNDKPVYSHIPATASDVESSATNGTNTAFLPAENQADTNMQSLEPTISSSSGPPLQRLPPQLLFFSPTLLYIQNHIQAIVIAAALRALTRLPASTTSASDFMQRVWTLLETEIEGDLLDIRHTQRSDPAGESQTKLANLADEVVRVRQLVSGVNIKLEEEGELRTTVERTLRASDPVFLLLRRRLVKTLEDRVVESVKDDADAAPNSKPSIPMRMQTGKDLVGERAGKRIRLNLPGHAETEYSQRINRAKLDGPPVPGFEDPVLQRVIREVLGKIMDTVSWTGSVWGDLV